MKKTSLTILIACVLILFLSSSASVTESASTSQSSNTSTFPVKFNLSTIDWTAVSSLLTVAAIYISIKANKTAQDAIDTTISIQKQATGLSMMQKRVSVISAIKSDNLSSIQESDVLYYFDDNCLTLYKKFKSDYRICQFASQKVDDYFKDLMQQYANQIDDYLQREEAMDDISRYEYLAVVEPDNAELQYLSNMYQLNDIDFGSDGEIMSISLTYGDTYKSWKQAEDLLNNSKATLITALEKILYQSLELPDNLVH